ncbi:MAG TPA: JAB domain-containing protein [Thiotrichaceae bacterium]|jgi:DNA repair protein RadC|nr:JAB domain-containing protein [Thiotrichaceae bacterium]HIM08707.1 JAB domain-containing protein [Gammaproteobacteria bacterium]
MPISSWPAQERPREKLLEKGPAALSDAEILAIFLRIGRKGLSALGLARELLDKFGGLRQLIDADENQFCQIKGLGMVKYAQIQAAIELGRRYLQAELEAGDIFTSPEQTREFLTLKLRAYPYEVFACLYLDNRHRLISFDELFRGTIDSAQVHAREVVRSAIKHNAAAVILSHNHPSGVAEPSQSDVNLTQELKKALQLVDVRVLDHLIIGSGEAISLAERGLL